MTGNFLGRMLGVLLILALALQPSAVWSQSGASFGKQLKGEPSKLLGMIRVFTDKDGVMTISSMAIDNKSKSMIKDLGLGINGTLDVELPKTAVVISSNTTSSPSFFGLVGAYIWKIGSIDQAPLMRVWFEK